MRIVALLTLLMITGCAQLPARTGGAAGEIKYNWLTKSPTVAGVLCNCWGEGDACGPVKTVTSFYENGQVQSASCEPVITTKEN